MAQIFISHSARDEQLKECFNKAFATSSVNAKYEEIEQLDKGTITTEAIEQDITISSAVFTLLSKTVDSLDHTRDWIGYEVGYAKGAKGGNKDVWVFEHINDAGRLTKVIPNFDTTLFMTRVILPSCTSRLSWTPMTISGSLRIPRSERDLAQWSECLGLVQGWAFCIRH
jgi:hypothetical protein